MARYIDHVLALLPFEPPYMEAEGMACDFVGHPIAAQTPITSKKIAQFQADFNLDPARESFSNFTGLSSFRNQAPVTNILRGFISSRVLQSFSSFFQHCRIWRRFCRPKRLSALPQDKRLVTGSGHSAAAAAEERLVAYSAATGGSGGLWHRIA